MNFYVILHFTKSVRKIFNWKERSVITAHFLSWPSPSCFTHENPLRLLTEFTITDADRFTVQLFKVQFRSEKSQSQARKNKKRGHVLLNRPSDNARTLVLTTATPDILNSLARCEEDCLDLARKSH